MGEGQPGAEGLRGTQSPTDVGCGWVTQGMIGGAQLALGGKVSHHGKQERTGFGVQRHRCLGCQCCGAGRAWKAGCAALLQATEKEEQGLRGTLSLQLGSLASPHQVEGMPTSQVSSSPQHRAARAAASSPSSLTAESLV